MKKKLVILVIVLVIIVVSILVYTFLDKYYNENSNNDVLSNSNNTYVEPPVKEEVKEEYIDNNPIKIGIYVAKNNQKVLVKDYSCTWQPEIVMGIFYVIPTIEEKVSGSAFNNVWKTHMSNYQNVDDYRVGYNIKFTLNTGEVIDRVILNPDDAYFMFPKVMCFLYDDVNLVPGKKYYHITPDEMTDKTLCTSIKLVGDVDTKNIVSDIELTAFTYVSDNDFDPVTKKYRGNSSYTILIKKKN